mmetsp:Transcript_8076/g.29999  ORF Transcript_8076/g.29999 Transcript_8076/m.29999 type:complete len:144 (+) Transcript_8076:45-476(+)
MESLVQLIERPVLWHELAVFSPSYFSCNCVHRANHIQAPFPLVSTPLLVMRSSSLFVFLALQIAVCLVLLLSLSQPADASMREWPVPPFPSSLLKGTLPDSYADMVTPWQNYLIYLGLVLVLPLIYGFILFVLTCCGCCVRCG